MWLWLLAAPERLSAKVRKLVLDPDTDLLLSAASSWEIAIKYSLGRLALPEVPSSYVPTRMRASGVRGLAVEHAHALRTAELKLHHRDPFDRLLVAQAELEKLTLITADPIFSRYRISTLAAAA